MSDMELRREARLAEAKARRETPEFAEGGRQLVAEREAEKVAAKAAADRREEDYWEQETFRVSAASLDRHTKAYEAMLTEAESDSGVDRDSIASDIMRSYLTIEITARTRSAVALALELLRTQFAFSVREGLDYLRSL